MLLGIIDLFFILRAQSYIKATGLSVEIVFGLEVHVNTCVYLRCSPCYFIYCNLLQYTIMLTEAVSTFVKYILHTIDLRSENPWENKTIYMRYADIFLGKQKLRQYKCIHVLYMCSTCMAIHDCLFVHSGGIELLLYIGYMAFMLSVPFIPLHIARRVYRAARLAQHSNTLWYRWEAKPNS